MLEASSLILSISNLLNGKAIVISFQPCSAKYFAIETEATVIDFIPKSLNQFPISID